MDNPGSNLDRLVARVDGDRLYILRIYRFNRDLMAVEVETAPSTVISEIDPDAQEAARRVLARLDAKS